MATPQKLNPEPKRLRDLEATGILDTPPESAYDDITTLASYICNTPIAYISFIDDKRQWYKSRINVPFQETTLEEALCNHTIYQTELVHVPDLLEDDRFAHNPIVQSELGIRFYAGYPLITKEGSALGTLCVIDFNVRTLTNEQKFALEALGRQVVAQLELQKLLRQAQEVAMHDTLTGLPNRLLLNEQLQLVLHRSKRTNKRFAVLFVDLDKFKEINDQHGHSVGDEILKTTGERIRSLLRKEDIVARFAGDEFIIILDEIKGQADVTRVADAVLTALAEPVHLKEGSLRIQASIGASIYPDHAEEIGELVDKADSALYEVKRNGRGTHRMVTDISV